MGKVQPLFSCDVAFLFILSEVGGNPLLHSVRWVMLQLIVGSSSTRLSISELFHVV